ncbi:MAG: enoyl-CoA hydratase-related protein [Planctomycetota bacterium]|jgi:cyclohexa-1,5-dienecarbonyl-CoA hydratase|nr:enoyl-CoA hydratase-related protein [Planctomycetota bacterium]
MIQTTQKSSDRVLHILLDKPKANILDAGMIGEIVRALDEMVSEETCLIVFEGEGDHFSFGASVDEHKAEEAAGMLEAFHGLFRKLASLSVPTCAVVRGQCLGGGLELACWCTWVVATSDAKLGQPEIQLAVFPPMATILLPWRAGGQAALDLCVSGRSVGAGEALSLGVINAVTEDPTAWWEQLVEKKLARTSSSSLRFAERAVRLQLIKQLDDALPELERIYLDQLMKTEDANEGIQAFIERRSPVFNHR